MQAYVVMKGKEVDSVWIDLPGTISDAEASSQSRQAAIGAASFDNPQDIAFQQASWIAKVEVNPAL